MNEKEMFQRILIVGFGSAGKRHYKTIRELLPNTSIALLSKSASKSQFGENLLVYETLEEAKGFLPQIAVIANPAPHHEFFGREFASMGAHLLVEKPISNNFKDAKRLVDTSKCEQVLLLPGYNLIFSDPLVALKENLEKKELGNPISFNCVAAKFLPDWRPNTDYRFGVSAKEELGGGVLLELSHELNYLLWLFGEVKFFKSNVRRTRTLEIEVDDIADLLIEFESNQYEFPISGNLHIDFLRRDETRFIEVICEKGTYRCDLSRGTLEVFDAKLPSWQNVCTSPDAIAKSTLNMWSFFLESISSGTRESSILDLALETVRIVELAQNSSQDGQGTRSS